VEGLDEVEQGVLGQLVLVAPLDVAEDARERLGVRLLDAVEGVLERDPDVLGDSAQVAPAAAVGQLEAVVVGLDLGCQIGAEVGDGAGVLVVPRVGDPLVEQQREDVRLEVGRVDRAAQAVGGGPEAAFEFLLCERHSAPRSVWPS